MESLINFSANNCLIVTINPVPQHYRQSIECLNLIAKVSGQRKQLPLAIELSQLNDADSQDSRFNAVQFPSSKESSVLSPSSALDSQLDQKLNDTRSFRKPGLRAGEQIGTRALLEIEELRRANYYLDRDLRVSRKKYEESLVNLELVSKHLRKVQSSIQTKISAEDEKQKVLPKS